MDFDDDVSEPKLENAIVEEELPNALFRLKLPDQSKVLAHVSDRREKDFLRLLPGDKVQVRLSPYDGGRGRIVKRSAK